MKRRRGTASIAANPVLIGAVTTLVVLVAVFLAYNANKGLPFVPTRELKVNFANGSNVVPGDEVRSGGFLIGSVDSLRPVRLPDGQVAAQLTLRLKKRYGDVPIDSRATILQKSALGLKYVALRKGRSPVDFADGGTMPASQTHVRVQFDDVFKINDAPTRAATRNDLVAFGGALAGRGAALSQVISQLPPLLTHLEAVAAFLADPATHLTSFFDELDRAADIAAPVSGRLAHLFTAMATTFGAISRHPADLQATIQKTPATLAEGIRDLPAQRPFLRDLTTLATPLTQASLELRQALPQIDPALETGTPVLRRSPPFNRRLSGTFTALDNLSNRPGTNQALRALRATVGTLQPQIRYLGPYITVCNDWDYWFTLLAEQFTADFGNAGGQRGSLDLAQNLQTNSLGVMGATAPVNGGPGALPIAGSEVLHAQPYGAAINADGTADCEAEQHGYPTRLNAYLPPKFQTVLEPHTPGSQGPDYLNLDGYPDGKRTLGPARVPKGETYTRTPQTGPAIPLGPVGGPTRQPTQGKTR
jgi:virulence factor Mce-like protein